MHSQDASSDILRREIREQSENDASGILEQAEKDARRVLSDAGTHAEKVKKEIRNGAEARAEGVRRRILSGLHLEMKRQTLRAREDATARIFDAVKERLDAFRRDKGYPPFLEKLLVEGVIALEGSAFSLKAGEVERKHLTKKRLEQIQEKIETQSGRKVVLKVAEDTLDEGGVVVVSSDGRMFFDNRFSARMDRMEAELRLEVVKRVME